MGRPKQTLLRVDAFRLALAAGLLAALLHFLNGVLPGQGLALPVVGRVEHAAQDWALTRLRGPRAPSGRVVLVAVDERSLREEGRWPWSRARLAALVDRLTEEGAAAVGLDVLLADDDEQGRRLARLEGAADPTRALADAVERARNVTLGFSFAAAGDAAPGATGAGALAFLRAEPVHLLRGGALVAAPAGTVPLAPFPDAAPPVEDLVAVADSGGFVTVSPDEDGVLRRYRTVAAAGGEVFPSLGVALVARALGEGGRPAPVVPVGADGAPEALVQVRVGPLALDVDDLGRVPLGWLGRFADFPAVSAADVLRGRVAPGALRGRVAIVGATAPGTWDQRVTPFDRIAPGVLAHATFVENALAGGLLERSGAVLAGEVLAMAALAVLLALLFSRVSAIAAVPALLAAGGGWLALAALALRRHDLVLAVGMPLVQVGLSFVAATSYRVFAEEREKRRARETFGRFLAPAIVEQVLSGEGALRLGGEKRELSVLFADVRGFTGLSERLDPPRLLELLNEYLAPMTEIIVDRHEGTLDKYIGDAIMAFWGAPTPQPDHALRACRAALEMAARLEALREGWRARGLPELDVGIGINTGAMSVGFVGSQDRFYNYTVLGDAVNLAARLEGANRTYGTRVLLGPATRAQAGAAVVTRELDRVRVKGKREPVVVHELLGLAPASAATAAFLEAFGWGLSAYQAQRWDEAILRFREADRLRGGDPASRVYVERCEAMRRSPPGPSWDAVFEMHAK